MLSFCALLYAVWATAQLIKAVFFPRQEVKEHVDFLAEHFGYSRPDDEDVAERFRIEFMPERLLYATVSWVVFAWLYRAGL